MGCITSAPRQVTTPRKGQPTIKPVNETTVPAAEQPSERPQYLAAPPDDTDLKPNLNVIKIDEKGTAKVNGTVHAPNEAVPVSAGPPPGQLTAPMEPIQETRDAPERAASDGKVRSISEDALGQKKAPEHRSSIPLQPLPLKKAPVTVQSLPQRRLKPMPAPRTVTTPTNEEIDAWKEKIDLAIKDWVQNTTLTTLNLSDIGIGSEKADSGDSQIFKGSGVVRNAALRTLINFVATNSRPMALDLTKNSFRGEADGGQESGYSPISALLQLAACTCLTSLDLRSNDLSPKDGQQIAKVFCTRFSDYASSNGAEESSDQQGSNRENQDNQKPTSKGPPSSASGGGCTLSGISVSSCYSKVTGQRINLYNQGIGPAECSMLSEVILQSPCSAWLTCLDLNRNGLGSEGCKALLPGLASLRVLEILQIGVNEIGDTGCTHLANAISKSTTLKALYVYENNISETGCISLLQVLQPIPSINQLYLSHNPIGTGGYQALAATFGTVKWTALGLRNLSVDTDVVCNLDHSPLLSSIMFLDLMENRVDSGTVQAAELVAKASKNARILLPACPSPVSTSPQPANRGGGGAAAPGAAPGGGLHRRSSVRTGTGAAAAVNNAAGPANNLGAHLWDEAAVTALPRYIQSTP